MTSNSPEHCLYFRAIGVHVDPTLQDNVLLPDDFAEHIYHVGNSHDLHCIIQSGLIPGGGSIKKERHSVFFTAVDPMFVDQHEEVEYDESQDCSVQQSLENSSENTVHWCNMNVAQKKGFQFCLTRSNAIVFHSTLLAICIEKVIYVKSGEELYKKCINLQGYREKPYSIRICIMDARIFLISKREHPSTIKAKSAKSTEKPKPVAMSLGKPEAVTSTSDCKVHHTQPFNRRMMFAEKQSRN